MKMNTRLPTDETTGFGSNNAMYGGRLVNKNGRTNIKKTGIRFWESISVYHTLLQISRWKFLMLIFLFFLMFNLVFACVYLWIGIQHLSGMVAITPAQKFIEAFFFSAQTFTTVGYGRISPTGYMTSFVASLEAFAGLLFFAIATGLFYARFSRPQSFIRFSHHALIAPYKEGIALMCRMVPYKNNRLTDAQVTLTLAMVENESGKMVNRFYPLPLEIPRINALSLSWTLVHTIDEKSPLYGWREEDFKTQKYEILLYANAFDETFSSTVVCRTSYASEEVYVGGKFIPMYHRSGTGESTIVEMDKLHSFEEVDISAHLPK
jgi:inward rectifier potassium channel